MTQTISMIIVSKHPTSVRRQAQMVAYSFHWYHYMTASHGSTVSLESMLRALLNLGVLLHHDNSRQYSARITQVKLQ